MDINKKASLTVLILGIIFIVVGCFVVRDENASAKENTESTTATVIAYDVTHSEDEDGGESTYYSPVMEYKANGKTITSTYSIGEGKKKYPEGTEVEIKYNPDKPENFSIEGDKTGKRMGIIAIVVGFVLAFFPLISTAIKVMELEFTPEDMTLVVVDSTWDYLPNGETFTFDVKE